ncbi:MAG: transporter substrate-binding domain-containing protein [Tatlockia sp.]|nr:transporter substrate-binding domain-containing protein [Tatlockia sp.]
MKNIVLSLLLFLTLPLYAEGEILKIAVTGFNPPFIMQGTDKLLYGFDITMMNAICDLIKRSCQYQIVPPPDLIPDVQTKKVDLALSMTITLERSTLVNFSLPYLLSNSLFLGKKDIATKPFQAAMLNGQTIGVVRGTIFIDIANSLGIKNARIVQFKQLDSVISALNDGEIDVALMDEPSARYWQLQTSNNLIVLGKPIVYGYGLGIAINKEEPNLLIQVNNALLQYQNSDDYRQNYDRYMVHFRNGQSIQ